MSALTSSMAAIWSGVSVNGNASSSSRCHGVSGAERVAGRGLAGGVELHELGRDLLDRLLARGPWCSSSRSRRACSAWAARRRRSGTPGRAGRSGTNSRSPGWPRLDDAYSSTRYSRVAPATVRWHHLDVAADAVLVVHDVVAGPAARAGRPRCAAGRASWRTVSGGRAVPAAGQVGLGEHDERAVRRRRSPPRSRRGRP